MPDTSSFTEDPAASLLFGNVELQPRERRLLVGGEPVSIGARAFDLLTTLATRHGRLVTKGELLDLVWPGLVVEESNLHTQMSTLRRLLGGDVINTVPGKGYRFAAAVRMSGGARPAPPPPRLPPVEPTPGPVLPVAGGRLIGRDEDLAALEPALRAPGCVTLVGAGGVGKTRLALSAAQRWDGRRTWVDLAPLADGLEVAGAVARALGVSLSDGDPGPQLVRGLDGEVQLLVLDNAEHLVDAAAALVPALLAGAAGLRLLVTSQMPLGIAGERVHRLGPLAIETGPAAADGAVALLKERIAAADHRIRIEPTAAPLLREICSQLDGLPLALEMAAARVPLLGLGGVRDELAQRFALLTTGYRHATSRHRSLHAAIDWSFGLLGDAEKQQFAALGAFAGGFTLDLYVALAPAGPSSKWEAIDRLAVLVDRSLVVVGSEDPPRYRLLETLRAYALEQLRAQDAEQSARRRHAEVLLAYLSAQPRDDRSDALCLAELDNVREAIGWARTHGPALAVALSRQAAVRTSFSPWRAEAYAWMRSFEPLMRSPLAESFELELRAQWWIEYARNALMHMSEDAPELARTALALARELKQAEWLFVATVVFVRSARAPGPEIDEGCADIVRLDREHPEWLPQRRLMGLGTLALVAERAGDHERQLDVRRQELSVALQAGLRTWADAAETNVVVALNKLGRHEEALVMASATVQRLQGQPNANLAWAWYGQVRALLSLERIEDGRAALREAIAACAEFDLPIFAPLLARLAWLRRRPEAAAKLSGHAVQAFERRGMDIQEAADLLDPVCDDASRLLGVGAVEALVREGRTLDEMQAVDLACGD